MANIAPWLSVKNVTEARAFYKKAFDAAELYCLESEDGTPVVSHLSIEGADFWIQENNDGGTELIEKSINRMILTVENPDKVFETALLAEAIQVSPVIEEHGWRLGHLVDPFGYHWEIGKPV